MCDRVKMLEATLDLMDEGVAVLDQEANILFWNRAATMFTGHQAADMIARPFPTDLYQVDQKHRDRAAADLHSGSRCRRRDGEQPDSELALLPATWIEPEADSREDESLRCPTLVSMNHALGYPIPGMLRKVALRGPCGEFSGCALVFYPVDDVDTLPHGEGGEGADIERSQADMEDRLDAAHHQWITSTVPFGLLWIIVDQAQSLRKTHGGDACEAMLRTMEQTLLRQLKPAEVIGRWGNNEFLVLTHARTAELLAEHARRLAGLARTADFRWWGDRVVLTVSIGASHATNGETLQTLLGRARHAMHASEYAGGNQVSLAKEA